MGARVFAAGAAVLMMMFVGSGVQAKVERNEHVTYYDVTGNRIEVVMASLDRLGPPDDTGEQFHARTDARMEWTFAVRAERGGCAVSTVTTRLNINLIMPRLVGTDDAEVHDEFDGYIGRLMRHEVGHVENARRTASEIDEGLRALPPATSCREMKEKANAAAHRLFDVGAKRDSDYDRVTDHGRLQGAVFP